MHKQFVTNMTRVKHANVIDNYRCLQQSKIYFLELLLPHFPYNLCHKSIIYLTRQETWIGLSDTAENSCFESQNKKSFENLFLLIYFFYLKLRKLDAPYENNHYFLTDMNSRISMRGESINFSCNFKIFALEIWKWAKRRKKYQ